MENPEEINKLPGGLRHLRVRDADELAKYAIPVKHVPRPGFNTTGKEIEVSMNAFNITAYPTKNVYQYDVSDLELPNDFLMSYADNSIRFTLALVPRRILSSRRSGTPMLESKL